MNPNQYFDFWDIFRNELIGDTTLFILLGIALIWYVGFKAKVPSPVLILFSMLFGTIILMKQYIGLIVVLIVLVVTLYAYITLKEWVNR